MERKELEALLQSVRGSVPVTEALRSLTHWPSRELGHTRLDLSGRPAAAGRGGVRGWQDAGPAAGDRARSIEHHPRLLVTRVSEEGAGPLDELPDAQHDPEARVVWVDREPAEGEAWSSS